LLSDTYSWCVAKVSPFNAAMTSAAYSCLCAQPKAGNILIHEIEFLIANA